MNRAKVIANAAVEKYGDYGTLIASTQRRAFRQGAQWADANLHAKLDLAVEGFETITKNYMPGTTAHTIATHYLEKLGVQVGVPGVKK